MTQKRPRSSVPYMLMEEKSGEDCKYLAYIFASGYESTYYSNSPLFLAQGIEVDPTKCYFSNSASAINIINGELYNSNSRLIIKSDSKSKTWSSNEGTYLAINNGSLVYIRFNKLRNVTLTYIETEGVTSCSESYSGYFAYIKNGNLMYAIQDSSDSTKYSKYTKSSTGKWIGIWGEGPYTNTSSSSYRLYNYPLAINSDGELWNLSTSTSSVGTKYNIPEKVIHVSDGYCQIYTKGSGTSKYCPSVITEDGKMYIINGPSSTDFVEAGTQYTAKKKSIGIAAGDSSTQIVQQSPFITEGGIFGRSYKDGTANASQIVDENGLVLTDTIGSVTDICGSSFGSDYVRQIRVYATTENNELYAIREGATTWTKMSAEKILDFPGELVSLSGAGSQNGGAKNILITKVSKDWQPEVEYRHKVSAPYTQTLLLMQGGAFFQCGHNAQNQQGNNSTSKIYSLRDIAGDVKDIAGSVSTSWYVTRNGDLYGCGRNNYGQQGANGTTTVSVYTKKASNVKEVIVDHFSEGEITCYVSTNNELYMCGRNDFGQQGSGDTTMVKKFTKRAGNVKKVVTRATATWYLTNDGELWGCGYNSNGQQGSGDTTNVLTFTKRAENVRDFCAWEDTTFYITNNNELYGCGRNDFGQQGTGNTENVLTFRKIADNVRNVYGMDITTYITLDGQLYTTGNNRFGALGTGDFINVLEFTKVAENIKQYVNSGNRTAWYITENNELYGCGDNTYGAQGSGTVTGDSTNTQDNAQCITTFTKRADNVKEIYVSQYTTSYVDLDGVYWMCGRAEYGNQSTSDTAPITTFTPLCNLFIKGLND